MLSTLIFFTPPHQLRKVRPRPRKIPRTLIPSPPTSACFFFFLKRKEMKKIAKVMRRAQPQSARGGVQNIRSPGCSCLPRRHAA